MQIVIPMSGFGERLRRTGNVVPQPLTVVEGNPIIEYAVDRLAQTMSSFPSNILDISFGF
jgi:NDP-sugar pyrophosphorylase family protein